MNPQANDKLTLRVGAPETIALAYTEPRTCPRSNVPGTVMFTLMDGRKWFPQSYVGDRIRVLGVPAGTPIEVELVEIRNGNYKSGEVLVRKAGAVMRTAPERVRMPTDVPSPQHTPPPPAPVNGTGETAADIMTRCYRDAIEVALSAQAYARENGLMIAPVFEDIRAMGTALFIQRGVR